MAVEFDGVDQYLYVASVPFTLSGEWSIALAFYVDDIDANYTLCWIGDSSTDDQFLMLVSAGAGADPLRLRLKTGGTAWNHNTVNTVTAGAWQRALLIRDTSVGAQFKLYLNDGALAAKVSADLPSGCDRLELGRQGGTVPANYLAGKLGPCAFWNDALTADQIAAWQAGTWPWLMGANANLVQAYTFRFNDSLKLKDRVGSDDLTEVNDPTWITNNEPTWIMPPLPHRIR